MLLILTDPGGYLARPSRLISLDATASAVEIYSPEENAGDLMGDLNGRRGRIQGMDVKGTTQVIRAQVPMAEMLNYAPTLTSMTGGRGSFHMEQSHYDVVPAQLTDRIVAEVQREKEEKH